MSIPLDELPSQLDPFAAVESAYPGELARSQDALSRGLSLLVECDKELAPYVYKTLRERLRQSGVQCVYVDGRPRADEPASLTTTAQMIARLRELVRGAVERKVVVLPHLDVLTLGSGGLGAEGREVVTLLYENPELLFVGFKDPSLILPRVIEQLFPQRETIVGVARDRLRYLVTQSEARKFGTSLDVYRLYKYVSGLNAVRLRRVLSALSGEDFPADPVAVLRQLRDATLVDGLSVPEVNLERDIGGYHSVKRRLQREILDVLAAKERARDPREVAHIEALVPRGMVFWGPPGTGKTLFAKAMASALGAATLVVSGPELKSRWVGESEQRLRELFLRARKAAPAVIIFDELDSFAMARGSYQGSGVEHSLVNQLLTEMDGFRENEMVFVVGTTNYAEALDPALLRPGRFEFQLHIPYPNAEDRREILGIYGQRLGLEFDERALSYAVRRSGEPVEGGMSPYSGDHLQAICRSLARRRLRKESTGEVTVEDIDHALSEYSERPELSASEALVVATHEAGHAICSLYCEHAPAIERISIMGDVAGSLGLVRYAESSNAHVTTRGYLLDSICVLLAGREAETLLLGDLSIGAAGDLRRATSTARALVEEFGLAPDQAPWVNDRGRDGASLAEGERQRIGEQLGEILGGERARCRAILVEHQVELAALRELLLERKVIERRELEALRERING